MPTLKRGPRPPVDESPLPFDRTGDDVADFERFSTEYIRLEKNVPMVIRGWQRDIVAMVWGEDRPKVAGLAIGRGNSKSTLAAGICVSLLYLNDDHSIDLLAYDERQAGIIGNTCVKIIGRHPELAKRAKVFRDHIVVGSSELWWLPATPHALEGRTPDFTCLDEAGVVPQDLYEVAAYSNSKKPHAQMLMLGTPGDKPGNVLESFRDYCLTHPEDTSQRYMEFSAHQWRDHPLDCDDHGDGIGSGCLTAANPALGDWLDRASLMSNLPPKTSEQKWRTRRLVQFFASGNSEPPLPPEMWNGLGNGEEIPNGARVVLGFDGSYSGTDATVLVAATVSPTPHIQLVQWWGRPDPKDTEYRVPILDVEQAIRDACRRWDVAEVCCDSYRWQRSIAVLEGEGLPMRDFPQTVSRMSAATSGFLDACRNGQLSHSSHPLIGEHLNNAVLTEDGRGGRLVKPGGRHGGRLDAAITAVMAVSRATWHASKPKKSKRTVSFA